MFGTFSDWIEEARKNKSIAKLYLFEYYNTIPFYDKGPVGPEFTVTRVVNTLTEVINKKHALPQFLIIALDKDVIEDVDVFDKDAPILIEMAVDWLVKQISMTVRRKRAELLDKKPGAIYTGDPKIIFIQMIRRLEYYGDNKKQAIFDCRAKYNDALNNAVSRINHRIMTINSCNTTGHFDVKGNLSTKGKTAFWHEIDDLLDRFDRDKVKLLPNPLMKRRSRTNHIVLQLKPDYNPQNKRYFLPTV